jgi:uncharacterized RDD family membrane protein YckC
VNGQSFGPVNDEQLVALARAGYCSRDDFVYAAHVGDWVRADTVHGLFDAVEQFAPDSPAPSAAGGIYVPGPSAPAGQFVYADYAGFWVRWLAAFIDGILLAIPICLVSSILQSALARAGISLGRMGLEGWNPLAGTFPLLSGMVVVWVILMWPYYAFLESSSWQATVGKRAVGLIVTDIYGRRISFLRATGRYFASWISQIILWVGYIMGAFTARRQTLHDLMANTVVIHGRR